MKIEVTRYFEKDTKKLPAEIKILLAKRIELIMKAENIIELLSCKKMTGFKNAYRMRLGVYRIGFIHKVNTVELVRVLSRKDIYRFFP